MNRAKCAFGIMLIVLGVSSARAQLDPVRRDLVEAGYEQPFQGRAPLAAYGYYYLSRPQLADGKLALRAAISPVYLDAELALRDALGPGTDVGISVSGGGFAYDYDEIGDGHWLRDQSFTGHGAGVSLDLYHLFNPGARIPLNGVLETGFHYVFYERDQHNPPEFILPKDQPIATFRAGLRFGGIEPVLKPDVAAELSAWYEGQFSFESGDYGFGSDRRVESNVHRFWARGLLIYTLPQSKQRLSLNLIGGGTIHPDRLSAYRIGGSLPLTSEFPLMLPGYYSGEFSARNFVLVGGAYAVPIDRAQQWEVSAGISTARIAYTPGLTQARSSVSGASAEIAYRPASKEWKASLVYGYGFDAIRGNHRGADSLTLLMEFDIEKMGYVKSGPGSLPR